MNDNPNILIFIDWFLPAYKAGGPIQSVNNIIQQLKDEFNFYVVTSDQDLNGKLALRNTAKNKWVDRDSFQVIYLEEQQQNTSTYQKIFAERDYQAIYLNSLFSSRFSLLPLRLFRKKDVKVILAPRGMLGKGALSIKHFKKKAFLKVFKLLGWHKKITWHATAEEERKEIIKHFGTGISIKVATNLSKLPSGNWKEKNKAVNKLNVFFLSRISVKKNLLGALEMINAVSENYKINFTIIGPIENQEYWEQCENEIKKAPAHVTVRSTGAQPNHELNNVLEEQHVMLLPTQHENFGHVFVEAWQNGCPVIISDQTPWHDLKKKEVGIELPLENNTAFTKHIEQFAAMNQEEYNQWSKSAHEKGTQIANDSTVIEKYKQLFSSH